MRRHWGILLLGMIAGALIVHLYHARDLEKLYWHKEKLKVALFESNEKLARIETLWTDRPEEKICSVEFSIKGELNDFVKLELQRQASEITAGLIGSIIESLEPELVTALLHQRKFTVERKDYLVTVNWIVIAPKTLFNIDVFPFPEEG